MKPNQVDTYRRKFLAALGGVTQLSLRPISNHNWSISVLDYRHHLANATFPFTLSSFQACQGSSFVTYQLTFIYQGIVQFASFSHLHA